MQKTASVALTLTTIALVSWAPAAQSDDESLRAAAAVALVPTDHPRLSPDLKQLWFVPEAGQAASNVAELAAAIESAEAGDYTKALPLLDRVSAVRGPLGDYVAFYAGMSELRLGRPAEALRAFRALLRRGRLRSRREECQGPGFHRPDPGPAPGRALHRGGQGRARLIASPPEKSPLRA